MISGPNMLQRLPNALRLVLLALVVVAMSACNSRTDKAEGGVVLSISDFDGLPVQVSVGNAVTAGTVQIDQITVQNIAKDPTGLTSQLMNVEMDSYEVTFSRADAGTRLPPPLVRSVFGVAPVNGSQTLDNLPILTLEQLNTAPLSDLLVVNGGLDTETGSDTILLNCALRLFGRTLSGDQIQTAPARFTIEFTR